MAQARHARATRVAGRDRAGREPRAEIRPVPEEEGVEAAPPAARAAEPLALQESMGLYFVWRRVPNRVPNLFGRRAAPRAAEPLALQESRAAAPRRRRRYRRAAALWSGCEALQAGAAPRSRGGAAAVARRRRCRAQGGSGAADQLWSRCGAGAEWL